MRTRLLLPLLFAAAACSGSERTQNIPSGPTGTSGTGDAAALSARQWCTRVFDTLTGYYARCFGGTAADWQRSIDTAECAEFEEDVRQARLSFDAAKGASCNTALASASCGSDGLDIADCESTFTGAIAAGESCTESSHCADGTQCVRTPNSCTGSCTLEMPAGVDESCEDRSCADGLFCDFDFANGTSTCRTLGQVGAECRSTFNCAEPLWCNEEAGTCAAAMPAGGACNSSFRQCGGDLICAGPEGARACRTPKKIGETCTPGHRECIIGHCSSAGTCAFPPAIGETCGLDGVEEADCFSGYCTAETGGVCAMRKAAGATCESFEECESFDCEEGVCLAETTCE